MSVVNLSTLICIPMLPLSIVKCSLCFSVSRSVAAGLGEQITGARKTGTKKERPPIRFDGSAENSTSILEKGWKAFSRNLPNSKKYSM